MYFKGNPADVTKVATKHHNLMIYQMLIKNLTVSAVNGTLTLQTFQAVENCTDSRQVSKEGKGGGALKESWKKDEGVHKKWQVSQILLTAAFKQLGRGTHSSP